jgi:hypothetical protein
MLCGNKRDKTTQKEQAGKKEMACMAHALAHPHNAEHRSISVDSPASGNGTESHRVFIHLLAVTP